MVFGCEEGEKEDCRGFTVTLFLAGGSVYQFLVSFFKRQDKKNVPASTQQSYVSCQRSSDRDGAGGRVWGPTLSYLWLVVWGSESYMSDTS